MSTGVALFLAVALFVAVVAMVEVGYRLRKRGLITSANATAVGGVTGGVSVLMGLVLAFGFSNAAERLEEHRRLAVTEANAIAAAWARIAFFEAPEQAAMRQLFRRYVDARIHAHGALPEMEKYEALVEDAAALHQDIWARAASVVEKKPELGTLLIPPIDAMAEIATYRRVMVHTHVTAMTLGFMVGLVLLGALLIGTSGAEDHRRIWPYRLIFAAVTATAVSVIIDMEYPQTALEGTRAADALLVELRASMG